ncbi:MAG: methyl-accepting chemotaxis protein [Rhodocyclales bacterium]|nr:methyl-accepting chemotaxis protein [Rhodocyclales bacterium]
MKNNQPVTQREISFPSGTYLVSKTDAKGIITYANDAFIGISGFTAAELIGRNHNLVRHPDMPPQAFRQLWDTVGDGRPWRGIVKNRTKDGDHYWVDAVVVPIRQNDRNVGYMSVRSAPSRAQIDAAAALYARLNRGQGRLDAGGNWVRRLSLRARLVGVMAFMALMIVGGAGLGVGGMSLSNAELQRVHAAQHEHTVLAQALVAATEALVREGAPPAAEALKGGDAATAGALPARSAPLYAEVRARADALKQHASAAADADFRSAQERYGLIRDVSIGGTLLGLLLVAVAGVFLVRAIVDPLRRAVGHFDRISQNVLTDEIDISGHDEAGRLMHALATMQVHLKVMLDEIRHASAAIDGQCGHLTGEMQRVVDQSREQLDRVQRVAAATEEFTQSVAAVADSAGKTAATAVASRAIVDSSTASISTSVDATARVVDAVQASSANIGHLSEAIQKIGDITKTIKEIADQTNLLALNAAIEAARAGEQGRGFAVVADEVRKLAERTATSTNDITATVAEFRAITENAVATMGNAVREVEEGIGNMRASVGGLDRIQSSSENVARMAEHIAAASSQQAATSRDVAGDMETISGLIDRNTAVAQEAWQTLSGLSRTAVGLKAMVDRFKLIKGE